jgi:hypothetical protein
MRATVMASILALSGLAQGAGAPIDLDRPGAMDALETRDPAHYQRVVKLVRAAEYLRCESRELERLQAALAVADFGCTHLIMTSNPPRQRIEFTLDRTRYVTVVTLRNAGGELIQSR